MKVKTEANKCDVCDRITLADLAKCFICGKEMCHEHVHTVKMTVRGGYTFTLCAPHSNEIVDKIFKAAGR